MQGEKSIGIRRIYPCCRRNTLTQRLLRTSIRTRPLPYIPYKVGALYIVRLSLFYIVR